jgi:hypothetical protein
MRAAACQDSAMRCVAGVGLLALVGCNQILGITPTTAYDAPADVVPDRPHVVLDWQIATVLPSGAPDPAITYTPITPAPRVRIATFDGPFDQVAATYTAGDGSIEIPREYLNTTWRLEYTLAGDVPHEVQWAPEDQQGHLTVPVFGRLQREPVPVGSGYTITPPNLPGGYTFPRVFTTGLWTEGIVSPRPSTATVDYDFSSSAIQMSGTNGRPYQMLGDRAFLVDYVTNPGTSCRVAVGSAALDSASVEPKPRTPQGPTWDAGQKGFTSTAIDTGTLTRFADGLDLLDSQQGYTGSLLFGSAASTTMPGLTATASGLLLPVPVMLTLLQCPFNQTPPMTAQPMTLAGFPHVVHVQIVNTRTVSGLGGLTLTSGFETVVTSQGDQFDVKFPAAIPMHMVLTTPTRGVVDLSGPSERVAVGTTNGPFTLDFTSEPGTGVRVDYHDVVLHRIVGGALTPERIYTVTAPRVRIDGALLAPGTDYVLEIRAYKGHLGAVHGDFAPVEFPYGAAIVFTRTFKTS